MSFLKQPKWTLPFLLLLLFAPFSPVIDPYISGLFFSDTLRSFSKAFYHHYIYHYAVIPALTLGISSAVLFICSFFMTRLEKFRFSFLFLAASMALGAGFITHCIFKEFCFRPRPLQTSLFGGPHLFQPFYYFKFSFPNFCKSFPSGHATMGFYFINLCLLAKRFQNKRLFSIGLYLTLIFSFLLCYSRIAQGAHFLSDVFVSLIVTWYAALSCEKFIFDFLAKKFAPKLHQE